MSSLALARKWRPRAFDDMVGQEAIVRMLKNALTQNRIHHAYLLTGTRGVGKTTLGRILAKALNCETGVTATPCGTCHACTAIDKGQFLDLYEVDAASRTKVEDTRELLDNVLYPPTQGRYKVYLIDEVHMLSNHSFNALLKTLEEPPEHVKFILATTEPKKLPITILSRCLQFYLKAIPAEKIAAYLAALCQKENIQSEEAALKKLARAADGSMRDALSLLDQAIAYGEGKVTAAEINNMLGALSQNELYPLLEALSARDGKALLAHNQQLAERAPDFLNLLDDMISLFHQIALYQIVPDAHTHHADVVMFASKFSPKDVQVYYQLCLLAKRDLSLAPTPAQGFEMMLLRLFAFEVGGIEKTELPRPAEKHAPLAITKSAASAESQDWRALLQTLGLTGMAYALAANCTLKSLKDNEVHLLLAATHEPMLNPKLKERLQEALAKQLNKKITLTITITHDEIITPQKQSAAESQQKVTQSKEAALQDPALKKLIDMYDATVEVTLI